MTEKSAVTCLISKGGTAGLRRCPKHHIPSISETKRPKAPSGIV